MDPLGALERKRVTCGTPITEVGEPALGLASRTRDIVHLRGSAVSNALAGDPHQQAALATPALWHGEWPLNPRTGGQSVEEWLLRHGAVRATDAPQDASPRIYDLHGTVGEAGARDVQ